MCSYVLVFTTRPAWPVTTELAGTDFVTTVFAPMIAIISNRHARKNDNSSTDPDIVAYRYRVALFHALLVDGDIHICIFMRIGVNDNIWSHHNIVTKCYIRAQNSI